MAANGRGTMRPAGRSPPFLAIGLAVALVILGFNYWNLSVKYGEQANEIAVMESEIRLVNAKRSSAEKRSEAIADKVKDFEDEIKNQKTDIASKMATIADLQQENEKLRTEKQNSEDEKNKCKNEELPQCFKERDELNAEINQLKENLSSEKNKQPPACDQNACQIFITATRDETLTNIRDTAGIEALLKLYKNGGNVGKYHADLQTLADTPADNQQQFIQHEGIQQQGVQQMQQQQPQQQQQVQPQQPGAQNNLAAQDNAPQAGSPDVVPQPADVQNAGPGVDGVQGALQGPVVNQADMKDDTLVVDQQPIESQKSGGKQPKASNTTVTTAATTTKYISMTTNGGGNDKGQGQPDEGEGAVDDLDLEQEGDQDDEEYDEEEDKLNDEDKNDEDYEYDEDVDKDDYDYNDNEKAVKKEDNGIEEMQIQMQKDQISDHK